MEALMYGTVIARTFGEATSKALGRASAFFENDKVELTYVRASEQLQSERGDTVSYVVEYEAREQREHPEGPDPALVQHG